MMLERSRGACRRGSRASRRHRRHAHEAIRAVLSDDQNYELGLFALNDVIDRVAERQGSEGLAALALELALMLAEALERVASDDGLAAVDLVEVWFAD
jgi:hypothetical protein